MTGKAAPPRCVVLVSGAPGAGKSTLARPLAQALGFALLSKDHLKETLYDALGGTPGDVAYSRQLGGAAMALLWAMAARCPQVVLDANFRPRDAAERARIAALDGVVVEVYCQCPADEAARRFATRAQRAGHHPAHALAALPPEHFAQYDTPVGVGPVVRVDTREPVDIGEVVARIRAVW